MPVAAQSCGYIDVGVKPGIVLSSLITSEPSGITKKSTRARPSHDRASTARAAIARNDSSVSATAPARMSISVGRSAQYVAPEAYDWWSPPVRTPAGLD